MPNILERLKEQLMAKGKSEQAAYAIATSVLQKKGYLKPGTDQLTEAGRARDAILMNPEARAKDRAIKQSPKKHTQSDYKYDMMTNTVKLKKKLFR